MIQGARGLVTDCVVPGFGCGVWLLLAWRHRRLPGAPGYAPAPTVPECAPFPCLGAGGRIARLSFYRSGRRRRSRRPGQRGCHQFRAGVLPWPLATVGTPAGDRVAVAAAILVRGRADAS